MREPMFPARDAIRITVLKKLHHRDLIEKYTDTGDWTPCAVFEEGQEFVVPGSAPWDMPPGFCGWAWADIQKTVWGMSRGGPNRFVTCCTDGFRPVVFLLERIGGPAADLDLPSRPERNAADDARVARRLDVHREVVACRARDLHRGLTRTGRPRREEVGPLLIVPDGKALQQRGVRPAAMSLQQLDIAVVVELEDHVAHGVEARHDVVVLEHAAVTPLVCERVALRIVKVRPRRRDDVFHV